MSIWQTLAASSIWSSLAVPFTTFVLGIIASYIAITIDLRKSRNQELVKKRIQVYDIVSPMLNDLLCHILCRGNWKTTTPDIVIAHKRTLDRQMYLYGPFFSRNIYQQYNIYIHSCFETFTGAGQDAKIRGDIRYLRGNWGASWNNSWDQLYVPVSRAVDRKVIRLEYDRLIRMFARDVGVKYIDTSGLASWRQKILGKRSKRPNFE